MARSNTGDTGDRHTRIYIRSLAPCDLRRITGVTSWSLMSLLRKAGIGVPKAQGDVKAKCINPCERPSQHQAQQPDHEPRPLSLLLLPWRTRPTPRCVAEQGRQSRSRMGTHRVDPDKPLSKPICLQRFSFAVCTVCHASSPSPWSPFSSHSEQKPCKCH